MEKKNIYGNLGEQDAPRQQASAADARNHSGLFFNRMLENLPVAKSEPAMKVEMARLQPEQMEKIKQGITIAAKGRMTAKQTEKLWSGIAEMLPKIHSEDASEIICAAMGTGNQDFGNRAEKLWKEKGIAINPDRLADMCLSYSRGNRLRIEDWGALRNLLPAVSPKKMTEILVAAAESGNAEIQEHVAQILWKSDMESIKMSPEKCATILEYSPTISKIEAWNWAKRHFTEFGMEWIARILELAVCTDIMHIRTQAQHAISCLPPRLQAKPKINLGIRSDNVGERQAAWDEFASVLVDLTPQEVLSIMKYAMERNLGFTSKTEFQSKENCIYVSQDQWGHVLEKMLRLPVVGKLAFVRSSIKSKQMDIQNLSFTVLQWLPTDKRGCILKEMLDSDNSFAAMSALTVIDSRPIIEHIRMALGSKYGWMMFYNMKDGILRCEELGADLSELMGNMLKNSLYNDTLVEMVGMVPKLPSAYQQGPAKEALRSRHALIRMKMFEAIPQLAQENHRPVMLHAAMSRHVMRRAIGRLLKEEAARLKEKAARTFGN